MNTNVVCTKWERNAPPWEWERESSELTWGIGSRCSMKMSRRWRKEKQSIEKMCVAWEEWEHFYMLFFEYMAANVFDFRCFSFFFICSPTTCLSRDAAECWLSGDVVKFFKCSCRGYFFFRMFSSSPRSFFYILYLHICKKINEWVEKLLTLRAGSKRERVRLLRLIRIHRFRLSCVYLFMHFQRNCQTIC